MTPETSISSAPVTSAPTNSGSAPSAANVLASRYASEEMAKLWSAEEKVIRERKLWLAVLEAQSDLGVALPEGAVKAYESVLDQVDLASIEAREKITHHDLKARIEEFCDLAGEEVIHLGLTSRDVTENTEQAIIRDALNLLQFKATAALARLKSKAEKFASTPLAARTHNVIAQPTTFGKRFATCGEELLGGVANLESLLARQKARGIKGATGTQQDLLDLLDGDASKVLELEQRVSEKLGFAATLGSVGQVYPRSLDFEVVSTLLLLVSALASLCETLRLMAGLGHVREGRSAGQVGSSAMPHKSNARLSERIAGLKVILGGYLAMAAELAGSQWNEGDVSCSVVRRVMLPDAFYATDAIFETFIDVIDNLQVFPETMEAELESYSAELATSRLLVAATEQGLGRERAHAIISEHIASSTSTDTSLAVALGKDSRIPLTEGEVQALIDQPNYGLAVSQVQQFCEATDKQIAKFPTATNYTPATAI